MDSKIIELIQSGLNGQPHNLTLAYYMLSGTDSDGFHLLNYSLNKLYQYLCSIRGVPDGSLLLECRTDRFVEFDMSDDEDSKFNYVMALLNSDLKKYDHYVKGFVDGFIESLSMPDFLYQVSLVADISEADKLSEQMDEIFIHGANLNGFKFEFLTESAKAEMLEQFEWLRKKLLPFYPDQTVSLDGLFRSFSARYWQSDSNGSKDYLFGFYTFITGSIYGII